jgi:hypothetical protein
MRNMHIKVNNFAIASTCRYGITYVHIMRTINQWQSLVLDPGVSTDVASAHLALERCGYPPGVTDVDR